MATRTRHRPARTQPVIVRKSASPTRASERRHLVRETTLSGAFGGGVLGAGFGPWAVASGMLLGGLAGYLFERLQARKTEHATQ